VLREWLKRWNERRRAALDARAPVVRQTTFEAVREVASPLVEQGLARLEWTEPDPEDDWLADGAVELVPQTMWRPRSR
jgi:hypothetical protein